MVAWPYTGPSAGDFWRSFETIRDYDSSLLEAERLSTLYIADWSDFSGALKQVKDTRPGMLLLPGIKIFRPFLRMREAYENRIMGGSGTGSGSTATGNSEQPLQRLARLEEFQRICWPMRLAFKEWSRYVLAYRRQNGVWRPTDGNADSCKFGKETLQRLSRYDAWARIVLLLEYQHDNNHPPLRVHFRGDIKRMGGPGDQDGLMYHNLLEYLFHFEIFLAREREPRNSRDHTYAHKSKLKKRLRDGTILVGDIDASAETLYIGAIASRIGATIASIGVLQEPSGRVFGPLTVNTPDGRVDFLKDNYGRGVLVGGTEEELDEWTVKSHGATAIVLVETIGQLNDVKRVVRQRRMGLIIIASQGFPSRSVRHLVRRLNDMLRIPIFALGDRNPEGLQIINTTRIGSSNVLNEANSVPLDVEYLGPRLADAKALHIDVGGPKGDQARLKKAQRITNRQDYTISMQLEARAMLFDKTFFDAEAFFRGISARSEDAVHDWLLKRIRSRLPGWQPLRRR